MRLHARYFLFLLGFNLLGFFVCAQAPFPARGFAPILNEEQAKKRLDQFRQAFFGASQKAHHRAYIYRFQFTHYRQTGMAEVCHGFLSGPSPYSSNLRVDLITNPQDLDRLSSFLLVRNLINSKAWKWEVGAEKARVLTPENWRSPWKNGINHSPFDLLMPFINWPVEYQKSGRVCGRPSHLFVFTPSNQGNTFMPSLKSVRLALDDSYDAPLRIEHMDGGILPARTFSLQSFKKINDQWLVKSIDVKDRDSKSRTRFELQAVAHDLDLPISAFQPSGLSLPLALSSIILDPI